MAVTVGRRGHRIQKPTSSPPDISDGDDILMRPLLSVSGVKIIRKLMSSERPVHFPQARDLRRHVAASTLTVMYSRL